MQKQNRKESTRKDGTMKGKYLNPKADLTFKLVFGENPDLVMSLLNALLPLDEGEDYTLIQPVYSLNLVNEVFQPDTDEFYHDYAIVNVAHSDRIIEGLRFVFVELPKFKPKSIAEKGGVRETTECLVEGNQMAVLWLRFLTEISEKTQEAPAELLENSETRKALSIVEKSAMNESQLYAYEQFWDAVVNERVLREGALKQGLAEGRAKGRAEGRAEGRAKGRAEGRAEGEAIGLAKGEAKGVQKEKLENARKMKKKGYPIDDIAEITGLSPEEINAL